MHELDTTGLITLMSGSNAIRYSNRYTVDDIDYTDNSKAYIANMKANYGIYKGFIVNLDGDVSYIRQDGIDFKTQHVIYNKKTAIAVADEPYIAHQGKNIITGQSVKYNNKKNIIDSKQIEAIYYLETKE